MSRVIKAGDDELPVQPAPVFDARLEAERILKQAQAEAERIRTQAASEGRERGMAAVTELLVAARTAAARAHDLAGVDLRRLAVAIAERILGCELTLRPEAVEDIATQALAAAGAATQITIRCHPDDLAALERGRPRLLERCARARAVHFRADDRVARGGCIVETELATIDARLATQLEAIERALRGDEG